MTNILAGFDTRWGQMVADSVDQRVDNDLIWEVVFVYGSAHAALRSVRFAGKEVDPLWVRGILIGKREAGMARMTGAESDDGRCALCLLPFNQPYDDAVFGRLLITRNPRNRHYCNVCDTFIRLCPGQASLMLPVLVVDVKGSRKIRRDLRLQTGSDAAYGRALATFQRRMSYLIQEHQGFILSTIGDAVVGVWPSGFVPESVREDLGWDADRPARVSTRQALAAARAIASVAPGEFDGRNLPYRGALDTTEMTIFSVATNDPLSPAEVALIARTNDDERAEAAARLRIGESDLTTGPSDIGTGPVATDVAGEAIEYATALSSSSDLLAGQVYVTSRTFEEAGVAVDGMEIRWVGDGQEEVQVRLL